MDDWENREQEDDSGGKGTERRIRKKGEKQTDNGELGRKKNAEKVGRGVEEVSEGV